MHPRLPENIRLRPSSCASETDTSQITNPVSASTGGAKGRNGLGAADGKPATWEQ